MSDATPSQPRVLVVCEHASARFGGEAFLPLQYFRLLRARGVEAWLLTHARVESELRAALASESARMYFVPDSRAQRWLSAATDRLPRGADVLLTPLIHLLTQIAQRSVCRRLVRELRIDVVHEPIPVSPLQPSMLYDVGAPVVIGPMNGGMSYPPQFAQLEGRVAKALTRAVRSIAPWLNRAIPGKRRAAALLVANARTREAVQRAIAGPGPLIEMVENGVDLQRFAEKRRARTADGVLRLAFVGRLIPLKAVDVLLEALAAAALQADVSLDIIGDGPERPALEACVRRLSLGPRVRFHGFVAQADLPALLEGIDVLAMPSLRECGGAVVLEAMAMGLPVIAARWGGMVDYMDERCGILIELAERPSFAAAWARVITELAHDADRRQKLGLAARAKVVAEFDWERQIDRILGIYAGVRLRAGT